MGWFSRLFGAGPEPEQKQRPEKPWVEELTKIISLEPAIDGELFDIVGESHYQDALESIAGPKPPDGVDVQRYAYLEPEPDNPYDSSAVAVLIDGKKVGHLSRDDCEDFHDFLAETGATSAMCTAYINGGWKRPSGEGSYGVKLDIDWPPCRETD